MPCYDDRNDRIAQGFHQMMGAMGGYGGWSSVNSQLSDQVAQLAQMVASKNVTESVLLCSACRVLERMGYDFEENPALSLWWEQHKMFDEAQKA